MKSTDFGANFGAGYLIESGLNFGLRYNLGISNVWDESDGFKNQNSIIQLGAEFRI